VIRAALALAVLLLTGCVEGPQRIDKFSAAELTFHSLNAIDQAQSINAISHDCFREVDPLTSRVLGDKPSSTEFALYGAAISLGFHYLNQSDYVTARPKLRVVLNLFAIGAKGYAVARNHSIGMRASGSNPGCAP
jgi:hypothetical protein